MKENRENKGTSTASKRTMTREQDLFLACLSDFCNEKVTDKPEETYDPEELFRLAEEQSLDGILFDQCKSFLFMDRNFRHSFLSHVFLSVNRADLLKEIVSRFRREGIDLICMKGSVFRDYYPVPELRSMGDIDFIIRHKDRTTADRIMREEMQLNRMIDNHAVWTYWVDQFQFEVHDHMFYENLANPVDYRSYFDQVWDHCHHAPVFGIESDNLYVPDEEFHFLYLMTHTAKHITNKGCGFRAYLDMAFMTKAYNDMNWKWIEKELKRLDLLTFTRTCMSLCQAWFQVTMPFHLDHMKEDFYETVTEKTFQDGVFGLENEENKPASAAKDLKRASGPYYLSAIRRAWHKLFPPYEDMQLIPWYSFVDGRPWLLPVAWFYRFIYCFIHKRDHSKDLLAEPFVREKEVKERQTYLKSWGL